MITLGLFLGGCPQPDGGTDTYTVTFNANGGSPTPEVQTVAGGGKVTEPAAMTREGFTFGGWFKESGFTTSWNFADTVTGDIILYAKWTYNFTTPALYRDRVPLTGGTVTGNSAYYYSSSDYFKGVFIEDRTVTLSPFSIAKYETIYEL
jgi:uncharacterized repeat protein (TIGR02543 family)